LQVEALSSVHPITFHITYFFDSCRFEKFKSEGNGGMPEFLSNLPENEITWGAFKVVGIDVRGGKVSRRPKYVFVKFLPTEGVPILLKARSGNHKGAIKQIMNTTHVDIEVHHIIDCSRVVRII
jgi:hypothetical protein